MITFFVNANIRKPELYYGKLCLVSKEATVFAPYLVIWITVASITGVCTWVGHPACALTTARCCSAPVPHLSRITWHPPGNWTLKLQTRVITLVLDKLLTVWGDSGETSQLRKTRSCVMNVTKTLLWIHKCPALTVVTDDCHANSLLILHVAINRKRCRTTLAIRINDVISASTANVFSYLRTGSSCIWGIIVFTALVALQV